METQHADLEMYFVENQTSGNREKAFLRGSYDVREKGGGFCCPAARESLTLKDGKKTRWYNRGIMVDEFDIPLMNRSIIKLTTVGKKG